MKYNLGVVFAAGLLGLVGSSAAWSGEPKVLDKGTKLNVSPGVRALLDKEGKVEVNTPNAKVVCRVETLTGSRVRKPYCVTREEIEAARERDVRRLEETRAKLPGTPG